MRLWLVCLVIFAGCSRNLLDLVDNAAEPPVVTRFTPISGLAGQTPVRIEGRNFPTDARVFFGTQPGLWAIGTDYASSETALFAIPPLGTPAETEISVVGSNGEARAPGLFRVFDDVPSLISVSPERITQDSHVVVQGLNLNARDSEARLLLGTHVVEDFVMVGDRIEFDAQEIDDFEDLGHGWKFLRFSFTPSYDGAVSEAVIAVYVANTPEILFTDREAYANGPMRLWVRGWDEYDAQGLLGASLNHVTIGGFVATILEAYPYPLDSRATEVLVHLPNLASDTYHEVLFSTLGNDNQYGGGAVRINGLGSIYGEATERGCVNNLPFFVTSAVADTNYESSTDIMVVTGVADNVPNGTANLTGYAATTFAETVEDIIFQTGVHGAGFPITVLPTRIQSQEYYELRGYLVATFRLTGSTQILDLVFARPDDENYGEFLRCNLTTLSMPLPAAAMAESPDNTNIFSAEAMRVALHQLAAEMKLNIGDEEDDEGPRTSEEALPPYRFAIAVDSEWWRQLYELEISGADLEACVPLSQALVPKLSFTTANAAPLTATRLMVNAQRGEAIWMNGRDGSSNESYWVASLAQSVEGPYVSTKLQADGGIPCGSMGSLAGTRDGFLVVGDNSLCRVKLSRGFGGALQAQRVYDVHPVRAVCQGPCSPIWLSPNEQELWLADFNSTFEAPPTFRRFMRMDAQTGALFEIVDSSASSAASAMAFSNHGSAVRTYSGTASNFSFLVNEAEALASSRSTCLYQ